MRRTTLSHFYTLITASTLFLVFFPSLTLAQKQTASAGVGESNPVNLKVLASQQLTMRQLREIMEDWADEIGGDCGTCHVRNSKALVSGHAPRYNYADDSKQEKRTARVMYSMTEAINAQYVATVPNSGVPVTCATCHRGHLSPEPFTSPDSAPGGKTPATRGR
jgi:hypothetical protein